MGVAERMLHTLVRKLLLGWSPFSKVSALAH